jgi:crotonobetainyl-CoA:carnitine CoA-transferase CaiB-like acyl-CoA transferase
LLLQRQGNRSWTTAPQGAYRCLDRDRSPLPMPSDDWVVISVDTEPQWQALCAVIGRPDLASDPSLGDHRGRKAEHDRIDEAITAWTSIRGSREAATTLSEAGVPAAAAYSPDELDQIEAVKARGLYEVVHNPVAGDMTIVGLPVGFEHRPDKWGRRHAPLLGEHNRVILSDLLGRSDEEIDALEASGIIGTSTALNLGW